MRVEQHRVRAGAGHRGVQIAVAIDQIDVVEEEVRKFHPFGDGRADDRGIAEPAHGPGIRRRRGRIPDLGHDLAPVAGDVGVNLLTAFVFQVDAAGPDLERAGRRGQVGHWKRPAQEPGDKKPRHGHDTSEDRDDARRRERSLRDHGRRQRHVGADEIGRQHLPAIALDDEVDDDRSDGQDGQGQPGAGFGRRRRSQAQGENQEGQEDEDDFKWAHYSNLSTLGRPHYWSAGVSPARSMANTKNHATQPRSRGQDARAPNATGSARSRGKTEPCNLEAPGPRSAGLSRHGPIRRLTASLAPPAQPD